MSEVAPNHIKSTVLWNGGWDTYLVDLSEVTDAPETACREDWYKYHPNCTFEKDGRQWLMSRHLNWCNDKPRIPKPDNGAGVHPDNKGVRIIQRLGSGD